MSWIVDHLVIVTILTILLAVVILFCLVRLGSRFYRHEQTLPLFVSAVATVVIAALFTVVLNNFYAKRRDKDAAISASKRDRDARLRGLRDQHFSHLRPVLRTEASELQWVIDEMRRDAHITLISDKAARHAAIVARLWPDATLSPDLQNHFPEYDHDKRALLHEIETQEKEFFVLLLRVQTVLQPPEVPLHFGASIYIVKYCLGGEDSTTPEGALTSQVYNSLKAHAAITSHCKSLKSRAETIGAQAAELSKTALRLAEVTTLSGACQFVRPDID